MIVAFCDIDKVLNDEAFVFAAHEDGVPFPVLADMARGLDPVRCASLQRVLAATGAVIVIVSHWRRYDAPEAIAAEFAARGLTAPVVGAVGGAEGASDLRAEATRVWLAGHPEVTAWCVIDDEAYRWLRASTVERTELRDGKRTYASETVYAMPEWLEGHAVFVRDGLDEDDAARVAMILGAAAALS